MTFDRTVTSLNIALVLGALLVLVILAATAYNAVCRALDTRTDRRARQAARARHTHARTAADTAIEDAVTVALNEACCEAWWTSCGFHHDPTCPHHTRKEA
ncbi:hypothetical protein [Streptomyces sp. TRM68416]|uniref:hypothetical protein n=1 Tax=Streptomyces sp. TRM68416 TaxID=2758412 RepID=UPI001661C654|nr:hypothetical protein [Streptomyces sp. TRM68416]MBD0837389.1 hypothetical protein [Streptomyces sp. TRM68416]